MAVRVGFEPTEPVKAQRFSRPPDSTTLAPHRKRSYFLSYLERRIQEGVTGISFGWFPVVPGAASLLFRRNLWGAGAAGCPEGFLVRNSGCLRRSVNERACHRLGYNGLGGMAEWSKAAVLKTVSGATRSGVRIPLPPPFIFCKLLIIRLLQYLLFCRSCFGSVPVASLETLSNPSRQRPEWPSWREAPCEAPADRRACRRCGGSVPPRFSPWL